MASNYFSISPTGGTGGAYLDITATQQNNTTNDRIAVVTITNGSVTKTVTATQFGKPSITGQSFPISAPATGASYTFTIKTHYDVQFRDKPEWVKIDDGQGNYISSATTIPSGTANGKTYNLTVEPNADNNDRTTSFGMYHYMYGNLMSDYVSMGISQPQGAADYISIPSSIAIDWDDNNNAKGITVEANVTWSASISNTTDFTLYGGQGTVSIKANNVNTGSTRKSTTLSIASTKAGFSYTATCVVTQFRQPTISIVDGGTVPPTGGSKTVRVVSDYYWWIYPTVMPETPSANIPYITMTGKQAGQNMSPTEGANYTLTWNSNTGNIRNDNLYVGFLRTDNTSTGRSATYANYIQDNEASETLSVSPNRIPENATSYVSSGGGTYQVVVTTGRPWQLNGTPSFCVVNPSTGTGTTTVTITVPATNLNRYRNESIYFVTNDAGQVASDSVAVFQEAMYVEEPYIVVQPDYFEFTTSGAVSNNEFTVSANTNWSCVMEEWLHMSPTTGGTGNTTHYFSIDENTGATRDGSIDFVPLGAGTSIAFLNIRQASGTTPVVVDSISLGSSGKSIGSGTSVLNSVYVTASTAWNITSSPNWITWSTTGGTAGTQFINWSADANTGSSRTGTTTFVAGTASTTYTVEQSAAYTPPTPTWVASPDEFEEPSQTSQTLYVDVTAATAWYVTKDGDADANWVNILQPTIQAAAGTYQMAFYITQNNSGAPRSARIDIVSATDNQVKLTVFVDQDYP